MLAPRLRGAFAITTVLAFALLAGCHDSTGPTPGNGVFDASSLQPGAVTADVISSAGNSGVFVAGGSSGADFTVVPFNGSTTYSSTASLTFTSQGASAPTISASLSPSTSPFASSAAPSLLLEPGSISLSSSPSFESVLRMSERRVLARMIPSARAWQSASLTGTVSRLAPSYDALPSSVTVGQLLTINTRSGSSFADACQTPDNRIGRVVAVTSKAIVVADTANPAGGYTDADYQSIGVTFDTLVYALDVNTFGAPSDIDNNGGRMVLFFTRAVNELTPANSNSVVGGFFYARDLFPQHTTAQLDSCPTSNVGEMFYLMVPDPNGVVNGNKRALDYVTRLTISTTAHEFQHLINASRRIFVNNASDFEDVWLNEGLSHVAEELLFYRQSAGLAPRENIDATKLRSAQQDVDAFNNDQINNFGRYLEYLKKPSVTSPYAPNDSLSTRGATWNFLRYAADHHGTLDGNVWYQLVNSTTTGMANLTNVFGTSLPTLFRDWAVGTQTDDLVSTDPAYQKVSWNFRSIYPALNITTFPLQTVSLTDASPATVTLNGGSSAYLRFSVPAGQKATIKWGTAPANMSVMVVRTR